MRNFSGSKRSDRGRGSSKRRGNDFGRPGMHKTTCDSCGQTCEVPFKPTTGKPIYCDSCFDKGQDESPRRSGRDRDDRKFGGRDSRRRDFGGRDSAMHSVVCDSCGKDCEVPFKPTKGKPIYCDDCFGKNKGNDSDQLTKEIKLLNKKLDMILSILAPDFEGDFFDEDADELKEPKIQTWKRKKKVLKRNKK